MTETPPSTPPPESRDDAERLYDDPHFVLQFMNDEDVLYELQLDEFQVTLHPDNKQILLNLTGNQVAEAKEQRVIRDRIIDGHDARDASLAAANEKLEEWEKRFDLFYDAQMRGSALWRKGNPGTELVTPYMAMLTAWLLEQLTAANAERDDYKSLYESQGAEYKLARQRLMINKTAAQPDAGARGEAQDAGSLNLAALTGEGSVVSDQRVEANTPPRSPSSEAAPPSAEDVAQTRKRATPFVHSLCPNDFGEGPCDYPDCRDSMCEWWQKGDAFAQALEVFRVATRQAGIRAGREQVAAIAIEAIRFAHGWIADLLGTMPAGFEDKRAAQQALEEAELHIRALTLDPKEK